jgi:hypothetical protein
MSWLHTPPSPVAEMPLSKGTPLDPLLPELPLEPLLPELPLLPLDPLLPELPELPLDPLLPELPELPLLPLEPLSGGVTVESLDPPHAAASTPAITNIAVIEPRPTRDEKRSFMLDLSPAVPRSQAIADLRGRPRSVVP